MSVKRILKENIDFYAEKYPLIGLTGPRQSGKTTLLKEIFTAYTYISLENPDNRQFAETDPNSFLDTYDHHVILDEVQRVPTLFSYLQTRVDDSQKMGQYILSGSQNFRLRENITQSLSGRIALFRLFPFDLQEMKAANLLLEDPFEMMVKGFYPAIYDRKIPSRNYYRNYFETYIERDIFEILNIQDHQAFRNFVRICAHNASQLLNLSAIAKKCGISQPTAKAWLSVLQNSFIIFLLQPYYKNFSKRIIKSPKLYFYDSGLLSHLLNVADRETVIKKDLKGILFENMMVSEALKQDAHNELNISFSFWRDSNQKEVDLIAESTAGTDIFEIKSTATIQNKIFTNLNFVADLFDSDVQRKLIYAGQQNQKRKQAKVIAWNSDLF